MFKGWRVQDSAEHRHLHRCLEEGRERADVPVCRLDGQGGPRHRLLPSSSTPSVGAFAGAGCRCHQGDVLEQLQVRHARAARGRLQGRCRRVGLGHRALQVLLQGPLLGRLPLGRGHVHGPVLPEAAGHRAHQQLRPAPRGSLRPTTRLGDVPQQVGRGLPPFQGSGCLCSLPESSTALTPELHVGGALPKGNAYLPPQAVSMRTLPIDV
mmetsp:Transcript_7619/g.21111  ORF Transcript_7619/g.21111 Transcript_7619/m.21111 type:complete len:210 (-) Transcript_7619:66-695(-)